MEVIKSPSDGRNYRAFELPNGLRAILIHDPHIITPAPTSRGNDVHASNHHHRRHPDDNNDATSMPSASASEESHSHSEFGSESEKESEEESEEEHEHVRPHHPRSSPPSPTAIKKAAAALSVGIGYYSDPDHLQGLSHYLEHMLFMGSEKYPDENEYDAFLSAHSGSSNACTEEESTTYHFDCAPDALEGALDRFAQFFVAPLVKADALEREVQAVDNEFSGVLQSDGCRLLQLRAHSARQGHVVRKFGWGNRKSLVDDPGAAGIDVRSQLLDHYQTQYSAERMNLVVLGGEPLDVLEGWVRQKFVAVRSGKGPRPRYTHCGFPLPQNPLHDTTITIAPAVRDEHRIVIVFQLPCLEACYPKKSEEYLSHLIGHEGKGSLLAALKMRGWATELCAGISDQTSAAYIFEVSIQLTEAGLAAGPGCGLAAATLLFQYLSMLRSQEPPKWAWDEMKTIAEMKWRFLEEEDAADYVAQIAGDLHTYPTHHALIGPYIHDEFDPEHIKSLLNEYLNPNTTAVRVEVQTKRTEACRCQLDALLARDDTSTAGNDLQSGPTVEMGEEPWFKIPYTCAVLPQSFVQKEWGSGAGAGGAGGAGTDDLSLPPPNPYLPSDFSLRSSVSVSEIHADPAPVFPSPPEQLLTSTTSTTTTKGENKNQPGLCLWHKLDSTFKVPRTNAYFRLSLPASCSTPRAAALTHLTVKLLEDALCQESYLADVASLHYSIWFEGVSGVDIKVDGFSDKLPLLAKFIFKTLAGLQCTDDAWRRVHEALVRSYRNANTKPMKHANYLRLQVLRRHAWSVDQVLTELERIAPSDSRAFLPELFSDIHIKALLFGNISKEEAVELGEAVRAVMSAAGTAIPSDRTIRLPCHPTTHFVLSRPAVNPEEENSVIESYFQCGDTTLDPRQRGLLDLIDQLLYEPCYNTLRTKEQLGYSVHSGPRLTYGISGLCIVIQSGVYDPCHLDARIDAFLSSFLTTLREMSDEEFEKNREALLANKMIKDRNLGEAGDRAWDVLVSRGKNFKHREEEISLIRELRKEDVMEYFREKVVVGGRERRKLAVCVVGRAADKGGAGEKGRNAYGGDALLIEDIDAFKKESEFYPSLVSS